MSQPPFPVITRSFPEYCVRRGFTTPKAAHAFLDRQLYSPADPGELPGLSTIADRLVLAIQGRQPICVWGDFDADGQTSTTILYQTLQELGADVTFHIPVRERESHGVNIPLLEKIIAEGAKVILTCDTGITAHAAVEFANSHGVDMLITDHHDLSESLPNAFALTDPKLLPQGHPLFTLSGSGVAYKLAEELYARFPLSKADVTRHLDLAAIGLVADLAALIGDARYLVQCGLESLRHTQRLGLQTIMEMAELTPQNLTEEHIGFIVGPRLNALGRLADARSAVELLTTSDPVRARVLATQLEGLNTQRQLLCSQVARAAEAQLAADPSLLAQSALVLDHPSWPGGVVGIVASRLVERYHKPAILFSTPVGEPAHGSARSVEGLNITAAIAAQKDLLINFGGHPMAAGLSLEADNLPEFRRRLVKTVSSMSGEIERESILEIDAWLGLSEISLELVDAIECLAPFGPGNEKLTLATRGLTLQSATTIGRNKEHLKLTVADPSGNSRTVLWWNGGEARETLPTHFDLAYSVRASDWRGTPQIQLEFMDIRATETDKITLPSRQFEIIDYRNEPDTLQVLSTLPPHPNTMLWAEGEAKQAVNGQDRHALSPAPALAIWTIPPSAQELQAALEKVHPGTVYLFAIGQPEQSPQDFIARLAGLVKYAINRRDGRINWSELETATAQRLSTVRTGLAWLQAQGQVELESQEQDALLVHSGNAHQDPSRATQLLSELRFLLAETAAYRLHFQKAAKESLFGLS